jgi:tetratricopeptide (TPR) repeat protein
MLGHLNQRLARTALGCIGFMLCGLSCAAQQVETPIPATPATAAVETTHAAVDPVLSMPPSEGLADALTAHGRYLLAIKTYEALPPTAPIENKLGIACLHMRMFDKAHASFEAALKINPKYAEAYNNLGTLAHSQNDFRHAEKMYQKSLKLNGDAANTWQNLGTLYYAEHKFKQGDKAYKQAIALDPHILEESNRRGITAQTKANSVSEIHYHLAMTYAQAGSKALALQYLRQAITEGFHDRNRLLHDKEFADLRTTEVFLKMVDDLKNN